MAVHFIRDRLILYLILTIGFIIHWTYDDLSLHPAEIAISLLNNAWQVIFIVGVNILYFEYALPFVTAKPANRLLTIVSGIVIHLVVLITGFYAWQMLGMLLHIYHPFKIYPDARAALYASARFVPGTFLVFAVVKLLFDYTQFKYAEQQVKLEKKQAELLFLRSQINPHFLFNTLNNIYSLSQHQPQLVSESVLRLSKILRYQLYEAGNEFISIDKEMMTLTNYIDLEKLRYNENVAIDFHYEIDDLAEMIPPLLLIPLVENAFKHGVSISRGKRFVDVQCVLRQGNLHFVVKNSSYLTQDYAEPKENIGLSNLRRRLDLLYKDYAFVAAQKDSIFTAELKINLSSYV